MTERDLLLILVTDRVSDRAYDNARHRLAKEHPERDLRKQPVTNAEIKAALPEVVQVLWERAKLVEGVIID